MRRTLGLVLALFISSLAFGQTSNFVSPGTDQDFNNKLVNVFEWILDARFTPAQRGELAQLIGSHSANDPTQAEAMKKIAALSDLIAAVPPDQATPIRAQIQQQLLTQLRQQPENPLSRLLLNVYQSSHGSSPGGGAQGFGASPSSSPSSSQSSLSSSYNDIPTIQPISYRVPASTAGAVPPALVGQWIARRGSGSSYYNPNTGSYGAPNATTDSYKFYPDGAYEHAILMQSSLYNCTIKIFGYEKGIATVSGDTISIQPGPGTLTYDDNCHPHLNSKKVTQMDAKFWQWGIGQDETGTKLCVRDQKGASACYYRQ
jgi:hypothetical protein